MKSGARRIPLLTLPFATVLVLSSCRTPSVPTKQGAGASFVAHVRQELASEAIRPASARAWRECGLTDVRAIRCQSAERAHCQEFLRGLELAEKGLFVKADERMVAAIDGLASLDPRPSATEEALQLVRRHTASFYCMWACFMCAAASEYAWPFFLDEATRLLDQAQPLVEQLSDASLMEDIRGTRARIVRSRPNVELRGCLSPPRGVSHGCCVWIPSP